MSISLTTTEIAVIDLEPRLGIALWELGYLEPEDETTLDEFIAFVCEPLYRRYLRLLLTPFLDPIPGQQLGPRTVICRGNYEGMKAQATIANEYAELAVLTRNHDETDYDLLGRCLQARFP